MKSFGLLPLAGFGILLLSGYAAGGYHLIKEVSLGPSPGGGEYFDYITVDSAARRVYLSHGTEFKVIDADTFAELGTISGDFKRNHGIALVPELNRGFITDGTLGEALIVDLKTLQITGRVKADNDA